MKKLSVNDTDMLKTRSSPQRYLAYWPGLRKKVKMQERIISFRGETDKTCIYLQFAVTWKALRMRCDKGYSLLIKVYFVYSFRSGIILSLFFLSLFLSPHADLQVNVNAQNTCRHKHTRTHTYTQAYTYTFRNICTTTD